MTDPALQPRGLRHLPGFFLYVLRNHALAKWALLMTVVILTLEYASLSLMVPLAAGESDKPTGNARVIAFWSHFAHMLGLSSSLLTWVWLFLVFLALRTIAGYLNLALTGYLSKQVHRALSESVFARVLFDEPITQIHKRKVGFYISLGGDDTYRAGTLVNSALQVLAAAVSASAGLVLLLLFSRTVFLATLGFLALSAVIVFFFLKQMLRFNAKSVALSHEARTSFLEALNSVRSIRSIGAEPFVTDNYSQQIVRYTRLLFNIDTIRNGIRFVPGVVALLVGIISLNPWGNAGVAVSAQAVFAVTTILLRVFISLGALMSAGSTFLVDARAVKDLGELTSFHRSDDASGGRRNARRESIAATREVQLVGISYAYSPQNEVLDDLTFFMRGGSSYAIVGPSGSGKSTLADVLLGMVEPTHGEVRVNDRAVTSTELRQRVVLVEQQPRIFSVSLRDNLTMGLQRSDQELLAALDIVDMTEFVHSLPRGLDTHLEYQGSNVSGGQRQRLAIARALLRRPQILILDEATSALDSVTRDTVVPRLKIAMRDGIILFITHDETVARVVDAVLELEPGRWTRGTVAEKVAETIEVPSAGRNSPELQSSSNPL